MLSRNNLFFNNKLCDDLFNITRILSHYAHINKIIIQKYIHKLGSPVVGKNGILLCLLTIRLMNRCYITENLLYLRLKPRHHQ